MKELANPVSAAILAGGKNSRMSGQNKAFLPIGTQTIIGSIFNVIKDLFAEIMIISNDPDEKYEAYSTKITGDILPGFGPLSGIHAALNMASSDFCFVVACDLPFLEQNMIVQQISLANEHVHAIVPRHAHGIEPLHAVWSKQCLPLLEEHLRQPENLKIQTFLQKINTLYFDTVADICFTNINSRKDLDQITTEYEKRRNPFCHS
jgi:molybdenum cofactor guanylyltransferase